MNPQLEVDLTLAHRLADLADAVTLGRYRSSDLHVEEKPDHTPVTESDRAAEEEIRSVLGAERPSHAVLGEEYGATGEAEWTWVIDPIDGTMNFVRGIPVWATLIALVHAERPVLGVVSAPALQRRWWAALGLGARINGATMQVSAVRRIGDAQLSFNALRDFEERGRGAPMRSVLDQVWRIRGFGDFWSHMLVAEGAADIAIEAVVNPWDMAAVQIIVEEAGGRFSDLGGEPTYAGGSALSTNGLLHDQVLAAFAATEDTNP